MLENQFSRQSWFSNPEELLLNIVHPSEIMFMEFWFYTIAFRYLFSMHNLYTHFGPYIGQQFIANTRKNTFAREQNIITTNFWMTKFRRTLTFQQKQLPESYSQSFTFNKYRSFQLVHD